MQLTKPKVIFCNEKSIKVILSAVKENNCDSTIAIFGHHPDIISFSDILNTCNDGEIANFRYIELDDIKKTVCIMHSSGTTTLPKGVEISNYSLLILCNSENKNLDMTNAVSIWFSLLYWLTGVEMNFRAIAQGAKLIIYPEFDEEMTCILIEKYKVQKKIN